MKIFNTTGVCIPSKHYMVDRKECLMEIKIMIDAGQYFTINRARQYGKTTTLTALRNFLNSEYEIVSLDFQGMGEASFSTEQEFVQGFCRLIKRKKRNGLGLPEKIEKEIDSYITRKEHLAKLNELFETFTEWCDISDKKIVLIIDEVDSAANNQVFLDFLAQLREGYISRETDKTPAFHSVILAGVTDIKNLKRKLRGEEMHKMNSPWNIASDFNVDMSLSTEGIAAMLKEYEADHHTGMDIYNVAENIYDYTNGYPYLVSRICKFLDTELMTDNQYSERKAKQQEERFKNLKDAWTEEGISEAVRVILAHENTLFDSLMSKVNNNHDLSSVLQRILFSGETIAYNPYDISISDAKMYGFIVNDNGTVKVANRIFETLLYNFYLTTEAMQSTLIYRIGAREKESFISEGRLNMNDILERFVVCYDDIYQNNADKFDEEEGIRRFLLFIRPIINGTGNYYIEARTRNNERMDLVVDYLGERYVIEMKIWRGKAYNERGEEQLSAYLEYYHLKKGYMLSYNFNKNKKTGSKTIVLGDKELIEAVV